jgi:glycosyltransferase involved in cell wall biosynthesis
MRVVVNELAALGVKTGVGYYTEQLLRCLHEQAGADEVEAYPRGCVRLLCRKSAVLGPRLRAGSADASGRRRPRGYSDAVGRDLLHSLRRHGWTLLERHFHKTCRRKAYDLYHEPNLIPLESDCPVLATVHDLSVVLHPEWHPCDRVAHFERHFRDGLACCRHFLAVSDFSRREVIRVLGVAPERVTRVYNGIRPGLAPLARDAVVQTLRRLGLPDRYLLYMGTIEPRKNLRVLLKAYVALPVRLRASFPLLLAGGWGWNSGDLADYIHRVARHEGVVHVGYIPGAHQGALYNGARALVYPSLYEGFGLPPLEMMACGGAVLASTAAALVETVGARADLIDPNDVEGWTMAMARVLEDDDWRQTLCRGVTDVARPYTWDRCAAETLRVYRRLCGEREADSGRKKQAA